MDNFQQWRAAMLDKVGAYWDAAFREGRNGSGCEADAANSILHGDGGIEALMQAHQAALAELQLYRALCEGYTLEELQRMSLTFKTQIEAIELVRQREREACAKACAKVRNEWALTVDGRRAAQDCVAAIRARSEVPSHD